jgi:hypothetical protein
MFENAQEPILKLDPWAASSLLQKTIRRGEVEIAKSAARILYRYRGAAVFRRLCIIAVEDIGIADPQLLLDVARVGTDRQLRSVLGSDVELIDDLCVRMAQAIKDRSADYLYCAATKLETALAERDQFARLSLDRLIDVAADDSLPLTRRAVAALLACSAPGKGDGVMRPDRVQQLLNRLSTKLVPLHDALMQLATSRSHPFAITLPLLWSRWWYDSAKFEVVEDELSPSETLDGIPLYTFDFHTAAGKQALTSFARDTSPVSAILARWVPEERRTEVVAIAAFYADAAPVARRLSWQTGSLLAQIGCIADMTGAGCPLDGVGDVLQSVRENLCDLNRHRRSQLRRSAAK